MLKLMTTKYIFICTVDAENEEKKLLLQIKRDHTVKDLTQKLSNLPMSPLSPQDDKPRIGDMSGLISKAKEGLAKSKSKGDIARYVLLIFQN